MKSQQLSRGGGWVTIQHLLFAAQLASVGFRRSHGRAPVIIRWAGAVLLLIAAAYGLPGVRALGRNRTTLPVPKPDGTLVTTGIYAHVRHPLYASMIAIGFGWALLWKSRAALGLAVAQAVFLREKAKTEELHLKARFPEYQKYARQVPRFIPRIVHKKAS